MATTDRNNPNMGGRVNQTEAKALLAKHGSQRAVERATGIGRKAFMRALKGTAPAHVVGVVTPSKAGRSISDFKATYDKSFIIPGKIRAALAKLNGGWDYESGFAKLAELSLTDLGAYRDQFADHVVTLGREGRRAWAGTKKTAQTMRAML